MMKTKKPKNDPPRCGVHGSDCRARMAAVNRLRYAEELERLGEDATEWKDCGWSPAMCVAETSFGGDCVIHDPEAHKTWDQERHEKLYPGQPWDGAARDLACADGPKVWKNYIPGRGPVIRNDAERKEYMRLTGHREYDKGERFGEGLNPRDRVVSEIGKRFRSFMERGK